MEVIDNLRLIEGRKIKGKCGLRKLPQIKLKTRRIEIEDSFLFHLGMNFFDENVTPFSSIFDEKEAEEDGDTNNSNKNKLAEIVYDATMVTALSDYARHL